MSISLPSSVRRDKADVVQRSVLLARGAVNPPPRTPTRIGASHPYNIRSIRHIASPRPLTAVERRKDARQRMHLQQQTRNPVSIRSSVLTSNLRLAGLHDSPKRPRMVRTPRAVYGEIIEGITEEGPKMTYGQTLFTILNMYVGGTMLQIGWAFAQGGWIMLPLLVFMVAFITFTGTRLFFPFCCDFGW